MPGDGYITKSNKNLFQNNGLGNPEEGQEIKLPQQEQQGSVGLEEQAEYRKMTVQQDTLQKSRRTSWWKNNPIDDSEKMQNVKKAMTALTNFYLETEVPADEETYQQHLNDINKLYTQLIYDCSVYVDARDSMFRIFKSKQGYERLCMVKKIRGKANVEFARYRARSRKVFEDCQNLEEGQERPLWINVLAEARTEHVDLRKSPEGSIKYMGGNTSSVIRLQTEDGKVGFIKENEYNVRPSHESLKERYRQDFTELKEHKEALKRGASEEQLRELLEFLMREYAKGTINSVFDDRKLGARDYDEPEVQHRILTTLLRKKDRKAELTGIMDEALLKTPEVMNLIGHYSKYYFRHYLGYVVAAKTTLIDEGSCITKRNVANYRLAELLGLTDLIPASRNVEYIDRQGKQHKGIIMAEAKGTEVLKTLYRRNRKKQDDELICDAKFLLQMNSLQVMDIIAGQTDRHEGNLMVDYANDGEFNVVRKIQGIDNDMSFGTVNYYETKYKTSMKPLEIDGEFALGCLDERLYERIMCLSDEMLDYAFLDLLTKDELSALKDRVHGVRDAMKTMRNPEYVLVRPENLYAGHVDRMRKQKNSYGLMIRHFRPRARQNPRRRQ